MILDLPVEVALGYKSLSQKARVITEAWTEENMYCPACVSNRLERLRAGAEATDFICSRCEAGFQLKALSRPIGRKIVDAAYDAMMRSVIEDRLPHFLFLSYDNKEAVVNNLLVVPSFCLGQSAIEKRKPLAKTARRAGWVGCNIVLDLVPPEGRIPAILNSEIINRSIVRKMFKQVEPLGEVSSKKRGWTLDVLTVLRSLGKVQFTIEDAYSFENVLSKKHPENRHIKAKIRQQLQILRDLGYLTFLGYGHYRWVRS
jgi:type II restriction enzyme